MMEPCKYRFYTCNAYTGWVAVSASPIDMLHNGREFEFELHHVAILQSNRTVKSPAQVNCMQVYRHDTTRLSCLVELSRYTDTCRFTTQLNWTPRSVVSSRHLLPDLKAVILAICGYGLYNIRLFIGDCISACVLLIQSSIFLQTPWQL